MDSAYNLPKEYQKGCEIRKKKEEKENEKYTNDY